jgi:hypothetical protein
MSNPSDPYGGSSWQGQQPNYGQQPGYGGQPGYGQQPGYGGQPQPDNYLVWAILSTVLCCLPAGIVSIVYSTKVSGLWAQGRYGEAQAAAANAKKWAIISAIVWAVLFVVTIIFYIVVGVAIVSNTPSTTITTTYSGY